MGNAVTLSPEQRRLVRLTFPKVLMRSETFSELFYAQLFRVDPSLMRLVDTSKSEQGRRLLNRLATAISLLDRPDELAQAIRELDFRRFGYGLNEQHDAIFGRVFLATLERVLGGSFTPEIEEAWASFFDLLAALATEAAYDRV